MRRERHGRASRVDNDRRRRPSDGFRVRDGHRFSQVVSDAIATLPDRLAQPLARRRFLVEEVPDGVRPDGTVPLAVFTHEQLTVYRRPLEIRAENRGDLEAIVRIAVGEAVAEALGLDDDLDDLYDE